MLKRLPLAAITMLVTSAAVAQAQTGRSHIGPHLSYNTDAQKFGIGAQFTAPIASHWEFYPSFDYYLVSAGSLWGLNADVKYRFSGQSLPWLYVGGGLNIYHASAGGASATKAGANLIGGIESLRGQVHPFGEIRLTVGDVTRAQLAAGLNFTLGKH